MGNAIQISLNLTSDSQPQRDNAVASIQSGQPLQGSVIVKVKKRTKGDIVKLFLTGKEIVTVASRGGHVANAKKLLHLVVHLEDKRHGWLERGSYKLDFRVELPHFLPATMCLGHDKNGCRIQYKIIAGIGARTVERPFIIRSSPLQDALKLPCFMEPKVEMLKSMGFVPGGLVTISASVGNTLVGRGQVVDVSLAVVNKTSLDLGSVSIQVVEVIRYTAPHESRSRKITLLEMENVQMVATAEPESVSVVPRERPPTSGTCDSKLLYEALTSEKNTVSITIPMTARDSYAGHIINVQHYIKIKLNTGRFASNPSTQIPIHIGDSKVPKICSEQVLKRRMPPDLMHPEVAKVPYLPLSGSDHQHGFAEAKSLCQDTIGEVDDDSILIKPNHECHKPSNDSTMSPLAALASSVPSLDRLLHGMAQSVDASTTLARRLEQSEWNHVFSSLSPSGLGRIIASIRNNVQHVGMATILAARIQPLFTCAHCVTAIQNTTKWNRTTMVRLLAPLCTDWKENQKLLWNELSPWEQRLCSDVLSDWQDVAGRNNAQQSGEECSLGVHATARHLHSVSVVDQPCPPSTGQAMRRWNSN